MTLSVRFLFPLFVVGEQRYEDILASSLTFFDRYKDGDIRFIFTAVSLTFLAFLASAALLRWRRPRPVSEVNEAPDDTFALAAENFFLRAVLVYFGIVGAYCALSFLRLGFSPWPGATELAAVLLGFFAFRSPRAGEWVGRIASLGLPLLLLRFARLDYGTAAFYPNSAFLLGLAVAAVYGYWLAFRNRRDPFRITPFHVALIGAFLAFKLPFGDTYSVIHWDGYHTGEMLIPFSQAREFDQAFYRDFVSVHGWLAVLHGAIHWLFFDGTYATVPFAFAVFDSLFAAVTGLAISASLPPSRALLFVPFVLSWWNRFYLFPIALGLFTAKWWEGRKTYWVAAAVSFCVFALLFNHAPGLGLVIAFLPWIAVGFAELPRRGKLGVFVFSLVIAGLFHRPLLGVLEFVRANGKGTLVAFGFILDMGHAPPSLLAKGFLAPYAPALGAAFKAFKFYGWVVGYLLLAAWLAWKRPLRFAPAFTLLFSLLFSSALIPYLFGRVGTDGLDRVGAMSVLALGFVLPFAIAISRPRWGRGVMALLLLGILIRAFPYLKTFQLPSRLAFASVNVEGLTQLEPGPEDPVKAGKVWSTAEEHAYRRDFGAFVRERMPGEVAYFDFTNRQNYFFLFGKPSLYLYPSHLLDINEEIQRAVIGKLERRPPEWIWAGPAKDYEYFRPSLRAYRVYRWILESGYVVPVKSRNGSFTFLQKGAPTPVGLEELNQIYRQGDLGKLPQAWGRNWPKLEGRFREVRTVRGRDGVFPLAGLNGKDADFVLVHAGSASGRGRIRITVGGRKFEGDEFGWEGLESEGALLLPLGTDPRWLLGTGMEKLEISGLGGGDMEIRLLRLEK